VSHELSNEILPFLTEELPVLRISEDFIRSGRPDGAVAELKKAIKTSAGDWRLHNALGDALLAAGRDEEAIGAFIATTQLRPDWAVAYVKIGRAFFSRGLTDPALFWLRRAMQIDANCESGMYSLAIAEYKGGCRERVAELLEAWVAADPGDPIRSHLATAILGEVTPLQPPRDYVTALFDGYAQRFDESLAKLHYCGPQLVEKALTKLQIKPSPARHVLDAGCGTGLVGEVLRPYACRLVGVDLSENMVQQSASRRLYDELIRDDMTVAMLARPGEFNLVVAADALTYCGELAGFFAACAHCLVRGGHVIVIHEAIDDLPPPTGYRLNRTGRFAHHADYVGKCLTDQGFKVMWQTDQPMRQDMNRPVPTLLFAAEKPF
jgi:predicted TPR repeat methyltransferase